MRKRSSYRPKGVRMDAVGWVLQGLTRMNDAGDANVILRTRNHLALESALKGTATRDDLDTVIGALNMAEALCCMGVGEDWLTEIGEGQDALLAMCVRGVTRGRFLFTGPEMTAVKLAMEIHDSQLDGSTVQTVEKALDVVHEAVRQKRARLIQVAA